MRSDYRDNFSSYNPAVNFSFLIIACVLSMVFNHPYFVICSFVLSMVYFFSLKKTAGIKIFVGMIVLAIVIGIVNSIFNPRGQTVLFYLFGRNFTFEAFFFGLTTGFIVAIVLTWFACFNMIMTSDRLTYLFSRFAPSLALVLSMILRLVPNFKKKALLISNARRCLGLDFKVGTKKERINASVKETSILTSWALEGAVITADSMKARGFGTGKRTSFKRYNFEKRNMIFLLVMCVLLFLVIFSAVKTDIKISFYPVIEFTDLSSAWALTGIISYILLLAMPDFLNFKETIKWHVLKSKI